MPFTRRQFLRTTIGASMALQMLGFFLSTLKAATSHTKPVREFRFTTSPAKVS